MPLYHKNLAYTRVETIAFDYSFSGLYLNLGLLEILKSWKKHDVCGSVHHSTVRKENPTRCNNVSKCFIIPYLYEAQHVSGNTPPIIRSLKLHWQPLVFRMWKVVGRVAVGRCQAQCAWQHPITFYVRKTRGCQCSFRLLLMGGVSP